MSKIIFMLHVFLFVVLCCSLPIKKSVKANTLKLRIVHTNDMHSRFDQTSQLSGKCTDENCYGGFPRLKTFFGQAQKEASEKGYETIFLNAGDTYQGTLWYTVYRWEIVSRFLNLLKFDTLCLGNHEFDDGVDGLVPFVQNSSIPIVLANADLTGEPALRKFLQPSVILERNGVKIGVIGYLTPETDELSTVGNVKFMDEITAINEEAARLKNSGIGIIIALGHSGYEEDQKIAENCPDVDVVVGGHSHSFLYTGSPLPDIDRPLGPYPTFVLQANNRSVPVVQAYAYTKYVGILDLEFDENGEIMVANGSPVLMDSSIAQDPDLLYELDLWEPGIDNVTQEVIGISKVYLDGDYSTCRFHECNFGNLVTDALVDYSIRNTVGQVWTLATICLVASGNIRSSITPEGPLGTLKREDVIVSLPYYNSLIIIQIQGQYLLQALEWSVYRYDYIQGYGEFLQISGIRVVYNLSNSPGSRVAKAETLCAQCDIPIYKKLDLAANYTLIINKFMADGGDNFTMFSEYGTVVQQLDGLDTDVVTDFIVRRGVVYPQVDGRITFL